MSEIELEENRRPKVDNNKLRLEVDLFVLRVVTTLQAENHFGSVDELITYLGKETAQIMESEESEAARVERITKLGTPVEDNDLEIGDMKERR